MSDEFTAIPGYEVEAQIGCGGMGVVYRVRHQSSGSILGLKMLLGARRASFVELARFRVEIAALGCLNHPNIVKIRDVGLFAGAPFFAMEFAERGSLKDLINSKPQQPHAAAEMVRLLALALQHAHERGMLHRDLKPANVLVMNDGSLKVSDFGLVKFANPINDVREMYSTTAAPVALDLLLSRLSRLASELSAQYAPSDPASGEREDEVARSIWEQCAARTGVLGDETKLQSVQEFLQEVGQASRPPAALDELTQAGAIMGSPNYMAPEQARGCHAEIGPHTDVYALGGILYEMLTGCPPFRARHTYELISEVCVVRPKPPRSITPGVSRDIEAVCLKCLEKAPSSRYPSAAALAEDLSRFLDGYSPNAVESGSDGAWTGAPDAPGDFSMDATRTQRDRPTSTRSWWPFGRSRSEKGD